MTRILCLWLPNWPIQRTLAERDDAGGMLSRPGRVSMSQRDRNMLTPLRRREHATPTGKPRAALVLAAEGPRGGVVAACCETAIDMGIRPQMPVAEAKSLVPDVRITKYDPEADRQALLQLAAACEEFSPCVAIEEGDAPECLLMDISNLEHLWGSETKLAAQVEAFFIRRGWRVRIAIAETVGAAWGLARFGEENDCKMQNAKCKLQNEERPTALSSNLRFAICNLQFAISSLPIEALRIPANTAALLRELGIETVGQLSALPREELSSRFGDELLLRLGQWTGEVAEVLVPHRPPAALSVGWSLAQPTGDREVVAHVLAELVTRLASQLRARDLGAVVLACRLECAGNQAVPLRIGLFAPSACPRQLMELIGLYLESVALPDEVVRVELRAAATGRLGQRQGELFADRWSSDPHELALLVNRLASRLGGEQVLRAELRDSPLPERAVRYVPFNNQRNQEMQIAKYKLQNANWKRRSRPKIENLQFAICNLQSPRPLLLYPHPCPIEVTSVAPDGPPQIVWLDSRRERIARHWGPERIETLWWRGQSVRRDYYRVATEGGGQLWIFRRLSDGDWFWHGVFC
jgi:protein ImuB